MRTAFFSSLPPRTAGVTALLLLGLAGEQVGAWPFTPEEAVRQQQTAARDLGCEVTRTLPLPDGSTLALVLIPAGEFLMGAPEGESPLDPDECPQSRVLVRQPFWLGKLEVTNRQYRLFRPHHNSREIDTHWKDRVGPGPSLNGDTQPVCRVSWEDAGRFCQWLATITGLPFRLPTEAEWEYACRAGTDTPFSCPEADLPQYANFADASLGAIKPWALRDADRNDGAAVSAPVGSYRPNAWGVHDMHGNVAEWCATLYQPYPYDAADGREDPGASGERVVRGGSWDDRPRRVRSVFRLSYPPQQRVYNVGFRVACTAQGS